MEITYEQAKAIVARKNKLGSTLVTGHRAAYFADAAEIYARQRVAINSVIVSETKHFSLKLDDEYFYFCPNLLCDFRYIQSGSNYCSNCGVKLNWIK